MSTYRIVEREDGSWSCRRTREDFDWFGQLEHAVEHTTRIATENPPSEVAVHSLDGRVRSVATFD